MPTPRQISAAERKAARERFLKVRLAERSYQSHLGAVGRNIASIVRGFAAKGRILDASALNQALASYSSILRPWAEAVADRMILDVNGRDLSAWKFLTQQIGSGLYSELHNTPLGVVHAKLLAEQVALITSLPNDAWERIHKITTESLVDGRRAEDIAAEIQKTGQVSADRARLIARTEVGRTASVLVQARATHVGSEGYLWRTTRDADVRPALSMSPAARARFIGSHRALEGKFIKWSEPPTAGTKGEKAHAGQIYNCRCWPEPVLPDL